MSVVMRRLDPELQKLAAHYLRRERRNHTLDAEGLVNETYIRIAAQRKVEWRNREHFFGIAAQTMRRLLCDYARQRRSIKRGGPHRGRKVSMNDFDIDQIADSTRDPDLILEIEMALEKLASRDPVAAELVELRYYSGFTLEDAAQILDIPARTLSRRWKIARAWLFRELNTKKSRSLQNT
jgi:RNA polymerase sigma factor (TIGR02999 family)